MGTAGVEAALGPLWTPLTEFCAERISGYPARWSESEAELALSFELGLYLRQPDGVDELGGGYRSSPDNSYAFARTGADGQHFSVLLAPEACGVVVATSPMTFESPNLVCGETLGEFLALGCITGYGGLHDLLDIGAARAIPRIEGWSPEDEAVWLGTEYQPRECMAQLRARFGLAPWPDIPARLDELSRLYGSFVVCSAETD